MLVTTKDDLRVFLELLHNSHSAVVAVLDGADLSLPCCKVKCALVESMRQRPCPLESIERG